MKHIYFLFITALVTLTVSAQNTEVTREADGTKIIKGFFTKKELVTDSAFAWYGENSKGYVPEQTALQAFRTAKDSVHILAFAGTWCGDTKFILPKFFALTDAAGLSPDRVTLLGVDRSKKTVHRLAEAFNVINVPTFIILKNGQEVGRVVEYGKRGMWDKELGEVVSGTAKK